MEFGEGVRLDTRNNRTNIGYEVPKIQVLLDPLLIFAPIQAEPKLLVVLTVLRLGIKLLKFVCLPLIYFRHTLTNDMFFY